MLHSGDPSDRLMGMGFVPIPHDPIVTPSSVWRNWWHPTHNIWAGWLASGIERGIPEPYWTSLPDINPRRSYTIDQLVADITILILKGPYENPNT